MHAPPMAMKAFSLDIHGRLRRFETPAVMGILNVTPDSFYDGSRTPLTDRDALKRRVDMMLTEGADMIDVGGYSTRPGAAEVPVQEEIDRVMAGVETVREFDPEIPVSVDTFRAGVAKATVAPGLADIVNDVSGGLLDDSMFETVAALKAPYILMHMRGNPATMQSLTDYPDGVVTGVTVELRRALDRLDELGVADVIIDPGFGFSKTAPQNYELFGHLDYVGQMLGDLPMLVGISRKSMIYRPLNLTPAQSLPGTIALNTMALERGAAILRVHDVGAAVQARDVWQMMADANRTETC